MTTALSIAGVKVYIDDATATWACPFESVDADGCEDTYRIGGGGRDYLANAYKIARKKGNPDYREWYEPGFKGWGGGALVDKKSGLPLVQGKAPGSPLEKGDYLVSPTALGDRTKPGHDQSRYLDAATVPYVAVPKALLAAGVNLGDLVLVAALDRAVGALVGDVGPGLGEGSIALAEALGVPPSPRSGGDSERLVSWTVYLGTSKPWPRDLAEIQATVMRLAGRKP